MQLSEDPNDWCWVRWYWAQPGAKAMPFMHAFCFSLWDDWTENIVSGPQIHMEGSEWRNSAYSSSPGLSYLGTIDQWQNGLPLDARAPGEAGPGCEADIWDSVGRVGLVVPPIPSHDVFVMLGGQLQGGQAPVITGSGVVGTGGQIQGGSAVVETGIDYQGQGGQLQGGQAVVYDGYLYLGTGGQLQGGQAVTYWGYTWFAEGGQLQGGSAIAPAPLIYGGPGGQVQGNTAHIFTGYQATGAGGQIQGGTASVLTGVYIEALGGQLQGGAATTVEGEDVSPGTILPFAGATVPAGYLECDGALVLIATYPDLYSAIGNTWYGSPPTDYFGLPDLRGRTLIGAGTGTGLTARTLGTTDGHETHTLITAEIPAHAHYMIANHANVRFWDVSNTGGTVNPTFGAGTRSPYDAAATQSNGSDGAHNNMQPWAGVKWMIKT